MRGRTNNGTVAVFLAWILGIFYVISKYNATFDSTELALYITLTISYLWTGFLIVFAESKFGIYFFEPMFFISALYISIFILRPFADLYNHDMMASGINVIGGGVKATIIFTVAYTIFYIAYYTTPRHRIIRDREIVGEIVGYNNPAILYVCWAVTLGLCLVCMVSQGKSLSYIFSLGSNGEFAPDEGNVVLLFLSSFGITMVTFWLMILVKTTARLPKILITIISVLYIIMRNGRWLILVMGLAPVTYYYVKKRKKPSLVVILIGGLLALTAFAWMQGNRYIIHSGGQVLGFSDVGFNLDFLFAPFDNDLTTYKTFYGMVEQFPAKHSYYWGKTFLYTFTMFIPRALWPAKPDNPIRDLIRDSLNDIAKSGGSAVVNFGEFYGNFGIIGCFLFMFIFGRIARRTKELYETDNEDSLIAYAIYYPLLFEIVARGNFSGLFYTLLFAFLPFIIPTFLGKTRRKF